MVEAGDRQGGIFRNGRARLVDAPPGHRFDDFRLDAFAVKDFFQELRRLDFIARWVGRVDLNVAAEHRRGFFLRRLPAEDRIRSATMDR